MGHGSTLISRAVISQYFPYAAKFTAWIVYASTAVDLLLLETLKKLTEKFALTARGITTRCGDDVQCLCALLPSQLKDEMGCDRRV